MSVKGDNVKKGFRKIELNNSFWIFPVRYSALIFIDGGAFGQVCSAHDNIKNERVAIKKLPRPFISEHYAKCAYREIITLKHMEHENVLNLLDLFSSGHNENDFEDIYVVSPLLQTDLHQILTSQKLSDEHIQLFIYSILRALKYVHSAGLIHRDLKPQNIAVNEDCDLKLIDFGLARPTDAHMTGYVTTRWYRAPEIILSWTHYNTTADVWSVGCILSEMMTGEVLFPGRDYLHQLKIILDMTGVPSSEMLSKITCENARNFVLGQPQTPKRDFQKLFKGYNEQAIDLLEKMLVLDPDQRITAEAALSHPYLEQYSDPSDEPVSKPLDQTIEHQKLSVQEWRKLIWQEICKYS